MDLGLKGKVALVTGGSEGIGRAAVLSMSEEGANVVICARRADVLNRAADDIRRATGGKVLAVPAEATRIEQIQSLFETIIAELDDIDILVNNAGASSEMAFEAAGDETWQVDLDLKLFAAVRSSWLAVPHMRARGGGRIINSTTFGGKVPEAASIPTSVSGLLELL